MLERPELKNIDDCLGIDCLRIRSKGTCKKMNSFFGDGNRTETKKVHIWEFFLLYTALFFILCCFAFATFFRNDLSCIWNIDGVGQYYPAFLYVGQYLRSVITNLFHGEICLPLFDLSIGMGENVIGCLNYYGFGDPVNVLSIFATHTNGTYVFWARYLLGLYLAGVSFCIYSKKIGLKKNAAIITSFIFIFSGFPIDGCLRYYEWISVLSFFPLMLAGIEDILLDRKRWKLFCFSVCYGALCGFYYFYMASIAVAIYCLIRIILKYKNIRTVIRYCIFCLGIYAIGICIAAPFFLPSVRAYMSSERSGSIFDNIKIDLFKPSFYGLYCRIKSSVKPSSFYNYYFGILYVEWLGIFLYLLTNRSPRANKLRIGFAICILSLMFPIVGWFFNGFGEENDRWVFIIHFAMEIIFAHFLDSIKDHGFSIGKKKLSISSTAVVTLLVVICLMNTAWNLVRVFTDYGDNWKEEFVPNREVSMYVDSPVNYAQTISDDDTYRISIEQMYDINGRPENVAMINAYNGTTYWFSIINQYTQQYANQYYNEELKWRSHGFVGDPFTEALAGCKYLLTDREVDTAVYTLEETVTFHDTIWNVYKNPYYFGMVYSTDAQKEIPDNDELSLSKYNQLFYSTCSNKDIEGVRYDKNKNELVCTTNLKKTKKLIFAIPFSEEWKAFVDGEKVSTQRSGMYISIDLPEGQHTVALKYRDMLFLVSMVLSMMGLLVVFIKLFDYIHFTDNKG